MRGVHKKQRGILVHGYANSGKTSLLEIFREIFKGFRFRSQEKFAVQMRQRDRAPSLVVEDEWEPKHLHRGNIDKTKRLLEGQGGVFEEKYQNPFVAFEKAYFFLSANTLARVLGGDKDKLDDDELVNRAAMNTRLQRFKFEVSYKNGTKQPFDAPGIALALRYLYEVYQPNEVVVAKPLCTQIEYPDFPGPRNPGRSAIESDPALNIRAPAVAGPNILDASLGKRPLPI